MCAWACVGTCGLWYVHTVCVWDIVCICTCTCVCFYRDMCDLWCVCMPGPSREIRVWLGTPDTHSLRRGSAQGPEPCPCQWWTLSYWPWGMSLSLEVSLSGRKWTDRAEEGDGVQGRAARGQRCVQLQIPSPLLAQACPVLTGSLSPGIQPGEEGPRAAEGASTLKGSGAQTNATARLTEFILMTTDLGHIQTRPPQMLSLEVQVRDTVAHPANGISSCNPRTPRLN